MEWDEDIRENIGEDMIIENDYGTHSKAENDCGRMKENECLDSLV